MKYIVAWLTLLMEMSGKQEMFLSNEDGNLVHDCEVEKMLRNDSEDKWIFPRPRYYLGTVLYPSVIRSLSPTLKEHSPESVFPGIAMLCERFDNTRKWKNTIEFMGSFARKGNMFNSRHHWDMRTKFLDVRLRCMHKIVEDPSTHCKPEGAFPVRVSLAVQKAIEDEKRTMTVTCEGENIKKQRMGSESITEGKINVKEQNYTENELGISIKRASNIEVNFAKNELRDNAKGNGNMKGFKRQNYA